MPKLEDPNREVSHALLLETVTLKNDGPPDSAAFKPIEVDLFHVFPHGGPHSPARFRKPRLLHPTSLRCDYSFFRLPLYASRLTIPSLVRFRLARVRGYARTDNMLRRRGSGIQGTLILLCGQVRTHLLDVRLEGIGHREWRVASKLKNGPVDHVVGKPPVLGGVKRRIL